MDSFWNGFEKRAEGDKPGLTEAAEIAGLGTLAYPSARHLMGKPLGGSTGHKLELAGLGILAAPSALRVGKWLSKSDDKPHPPQYAGG